MSSVILLSERELRMPRLQEDLRLARIPESSNAEN